MVTNQQLYIAIGIPMLFNAMLTGLAIAWFIAKFDAFEKKLDAETEALKFEAVHALRQIEHQR